ncbi:hypothetical protein TWF481_004570 [Arthrobotrys musiformis]|uniref:Uncharacterized protein n=1 Tax=Arthrobotrys musiformis TaxID=47236 RepID=A0AAV9WL14_9PEZI
MTLSPRGYAAGQQPFAPQPPIGGIQDETPMGAGMLDSTTQHHHYQPPNSSYPAATDGKKTFTFTRKTVIIIAVVVVIIIGALVGGLVGGLKSKSSNSDSNSSGAQTSDSSNTGTSTSTPSSSRTSSPGDTTTTPATTTTSSQTRPTSTGTVSEIDTLTGTGGSENAYPTTATYSIIGASGISGISPTPFPGFDNTISSSSLLKNGDFKSKLDGWTNDDGCWRAETDPSTVGYSPLEESTTGNDNIARNPADDLSSGKSCNLTQVVTGLQPGTLELSFLWGHYERDADTWFYVSAGPTSRPLVILAMQDTPRFSRTIGWTKSAYSIEFEGGDFVVTFSAHSRATAHDVAQVQLIQK